MGKSCSKQHQGFEIFPDSVNFRTAPEGKPDDEQQAIELRLPCSVKTADRCLALHEDPMCPDVMKSSKFASECNLIVELPPESSSNHIDSLDPENPLHPTTHCQSTQTPTDRKVGKNQKEGWSYTYYDFETERNNLSDDCDDTAALGLTSSFAANSRTPRAKSGDGRRRGRSNQKRSRHDAPDCRDDHGTSDRLKLYDEELLSAYIKQSLSMVTAREQRKENCRPLKVVDGMDIGSAVPVPRRAKRNSVLGGNDGDIPPFDGGRAACAYGKTDGLPVRTETYPGGPLTATPENDVSSLLVERGSECLSYGKVRNEADEQWPRLCHGYDRETPRCPCARKHNKPYRNNDALIGLCDSKSPYVDDCQIRAIKRRAALQQAIDIQSRLHPCNHDSKARYGRTKIDRSCLCETAGRELPQSCGVPPQEIVMRHEHHHYHHYPKTRTGGKRRSHKS